MSAPRIEQVSEHGIFFGERTRSGVEDICEHFGFATGDSRDVRVPYGVDRVSYLTLVVASSGLAPNTASAACVIDALTSSHVLPTVCAVIVQGAVDRPLCRVRPGGDIDGDFCMPVTLPVFTDSRHIREKWRIDWYARPGKEVSFITSRQIEILQTSTDMRRNVAISSAPLLPSGTVAEFPLGGTLSSLTRGLQSTYTPVVEYGLHGTTKLIWRNAQVSCVGGIVAHKVLFI